MIGMIDIGRPEKDILASVIKRSSAIVSIEADVPPSPVQLVAEAKYDKDFILAA